MEKECVDNGHSCSSFWKVIKEECLEKVLSEVGDIKLARALFNSRLVSTQGSLVRYREEQSVSAN